MKTKYIKVLVSERLPNDYGIVVVIDHKGVLKTTEYSMITNYETFNLNYKYWLEKVPDYEDEMREMLEKCYKELLISAEKGNYPESFLQENGGSGLNEIKELLTKLKTKES